MEKCNNVKTAEKNDPNLNELGGEYRMSKKRVKGRNTDMEFMQINIQSDENVAICRDALSHMGDAKVYWAAAEAQYRFNNEF